MILYAIVRKIYTKNEKSGHKSFVTATDMPTNYFLISITTALFGFIVSPISFAPEFMSAP